MQQLGCWDPQHKTLFHESGRTLFHAGAGHRPIDFSEGSDIGPYGLFERQDDWSSCAYVYLDRPQNELPALDPVQVRLAGL